MTETYTYDAFGTLTYIQSLKEDGVLAQTDTALSRFLYAGEQYDEVSGLYYLRARRYDTTVGRFTQEDTYLGDGRNLYVYVQNNPLKYVDPSGYSTKNLGVSSSNNAWLNAQNAGFCAPNDLASAGARAAADLINKKIDEWLDELPPGGEQRFRDGVWNIAKGSTVTGFGLGSMYYSAKYGKPPISVVSEITGAVSSVMGVSDIGEGIQDIYYACTDQMEESSYNFIRDSVFGGNQNIYDTVEIVSTTTAVVATVASVMNGASGTASGNISYYAKLPTRSLGNKIYMNGLSGERELMRMFGGESQAYFYTSLGARYIDQLANNIAHESKVGYTTLTERIMIQIQKDVELISKGVIDGSVWHFFESTVNGKKGASEELIKYLIEKGIEYIIH